MTMGSQGASSTEAASHAGPRGNTKTKPTPSASLLVLACIAVVTAARIYSIGLWRPALLEMGFFYGGLTALPLAALCLVPQLLVPRRFKRSGLPRVAAFMLPAVALAAFMVYWGLPSTRLQAMLDNEDFAPLPASATGVKVDGWICGFAHEAWLRFTAPADEVEAFLAASPFLEGTAPEHFGPERMLLLPPSDADALEVWQIGGPNKFVFRGTYPPSWYTPEVREKGRRYECPSRCTVIVNDATGTVYIYCHD